MPVADRALLLLTGIVGAIAFYVIVGFLVIVLTDICGPTCR